MIDGRKDPQCAYAYHSLCGRRTSRYGYTKRSCITRSIAQTISSSSTSMSTVHPPPTPPYSASADPKKGA